MWSLLSQKLWPVRKGDGRRYHYDQNPVIAWSSGGVWRLTNEELEHGSFEIENRIRNLMWTISGDYDLDTKPDVTSFYKSKYGIETISIWSAILFGTAHLLLVFGGPSWFYILTFTICATIAGYIFPKIVLKTKNGFVYSYIIHWSFYATIVFISHTLFKI